MIMTVQMALGMLTAVLSGTLLYLCTRRHQARGSKSGIVLSTCGLFVALHAIDPGLLGGMQVKTEGARTPAAAGEAVGTTVHRPYADWSVSDTTQGRGVIDLKDPDIDLEAAFASLGVGQTLVMRGSSGLAAAHKAVLSRTFGSIKTLPEERQASVCFAASRSLPMASGRCAARRYRLAFEETLEPIALSSTGDVVAAVAPVGKGIAVLLLYSPAAEPLPEEACLSATAKGNACAFVGLLPGDAQRALVIEAGDFGDLLTEFGLPRSNGDACGAPRLAELDVALQNAADDRDVLAVAGKIAVASKGHGLSTIRLPLKVEDKDGVERQTRVLRSFAATMFRSPYWLTTCEEYAARAVNLATHGVAKVGSQLSVTMPMVDSALYVMAPSPFNPSQALLQSSLSESSGWRYARLSPSVARLSWKLGVTNLRLPIDRLLAARDGDLLPHDQYPVSAACVGLLAAMSLNFLQLVAGRHRRVRRVFWPGTVLPVACMIFLLVNYSLREVYQATGSGGAVVLSLRANDRPTTFVKDWPAEKIPQSSFEDTTASVWRQYAAAIAPEPSVGEGAQASLPDLHFKEQTLVSGTVPVVEFGANAKIFLHDGVAARNWYFRRSTGYRTATTAWRAWLEREQRSFEVVDDEDLTSKLDPSVKLLISPDLRFVAGPALNALDVWIKDGGVLLFSERPGDAPALPPSGSPAAAGSDFAQALVACGLNASSSAKYSTTSWVGKEFSFTSDHRLVSPDGRRKDVVCGRRVGAGAVVFSGIDPVTAGDVEWLRMLVAGLTGGSLKMRGMAGACRTQLLVQPFGAAEGQLVDGLAALQAAGYPVSIAVDPASYPAVGPTFEAAFARFPVVLVSDGTAKSLQQAARLLAAGAKVDSAVALVGELDGAAKVKASKPAAVQGKSLMLGRAEALSPTRVGPWFDECRLGVGRPRLIAAKDMAKLPIPAPRSFATASFSDLVRTLSTASPPEQESWVRMQLTVGPEMNWTEKR